MFKIPLTAIHRLRGGTLHICRFHHRDVARPGVVLSFRHIDILAAAQSSSTASQEHEEPPLERDEIRVEQPHQETKAKKQLSSPLIATRVKQEQETRDDGTPMTTTTFTVDVDIISIWKWIAFTTGAALVARMFWRRWNAVDARLAVAIHIVKDIPDLEALEEDDNAMADHLTALMQTCLPPSMQKHAAAALARHRARGDPGRATIAQTCRRIRAAVMEEDVGPLTRLSKAAVIAAKFIDPRSSGMLDITHFFR
ncbi:hypothetical protein GGX14DRAFT_557118 [Mycena pura]|uniref:Uncharacterized protein n=1 Tax=Mycena pura TaxID=153505 RepID=A0AAD6YMV1_9AGAR|nr:hypothetical protein GGX14DRAFT_557118 [Mycena pura]